MERELTQPSAMPVSRACVAWGVSHPVALAHTQQLLPAASASCLTKSTRPTARPLRLSRNGLRLRAVYEKLMCRSENYE